MGGLGNFFYEKWLLRSWLFNLKLSGELLHPCLSHLTTSPFGDGKEVAYVEIDPGNLGLPWNQFLELVIGWTQWWRIGGTIGGTLPNLKNSSIDAAPNLPSPNLKFAPRSYCWWRSSLTTSYVKAKIIYSRTRISTIPSCFIPVVSSFQLQSRRSPGPYPANKKVLRKHKKKSKKKSNSKAYISWKLFYTPFGSILPFCVGIPWFFSHPTIRNVPGIWPEPSWRHRAIQHWPCRRF